MLARQVDKSATPESSQICYPGGKSILLPKNNYLKCSITTSSASHVRTELISANDIN